VADSAEKQRKKENSRTNKKMVKFNMLSAKKREKTAPQLGLCFLRAGAWFNDTD